MSDQTRHHTDGHPTDGLSRRGLIGGAAALGAGVAAVLGGTQAHAAPQYPEALDPPKAALTYLPLDALAFFTFSALGNEERAYDNLTGVRPLTPARRLAASLPLPVGSVIYEINAAYQAQPAVLITKRDMLAPNPPQDVFLQTLTPTGTPPRSQTLVLPTPVTIEPLTTYTVEIFCSAGDSIFGVTIGYLPPTQSFQPFVGVPRVLDTRSTGGKLQPNEERTVALGFPGARGAVLNLTVTETEGASGGFVAVFPASIAWPENSSINWSSPNQNVANGVTTALDAAGQIKIRGGANPTHVIIDRIGWLL